MIEVPIRTCSTCPYFSRVESQCRVEAPRVFPVGQSEQGQLMWASTWPPVREGNWCARHPGNHGMGLVLS